MHERHKAKRAKSVIGKRGWNMFGAAVLVAGCSDVQEYCEDDSVDTVLVVFKITTVYGCGGMGVILPNVATLAKAMQDTSLS